MARESSFWNWLRGHVAPLGHFTRIESEVSSGVPDVYFALKTLDVNNSGWIELKSIKAPKRDSSHPLRRKGLREEQIDWIEKHCFEGVRVFIFIKIDSYVYVFRGARARSINEMTFGEIKAFSNHTIPLRKSKSWTQSEFLRILTLDPSGIRYLYHSKGLMPELKKVKVKPILKSPSISRR